MANTITQSRVILGDRKVVEYIVLDSDGTQETNTVIFDSSAAASAAGKPDPKRCRIMELHAISNSAAGKCKLLWDATTKVAALALPYAGQTSNLCFEEFGGLKNMGGTGITGDILLTTTGLAAGDCLTIILEINPEYGTAP